MCTCYSEKETPRRPVHQREFLPPICAPVRLQSPAGKFTLQRTPVSSRGGGSVLYNPPTTPLVDYSVSPFWPSRNTSPILAESQRNIVETWPYLKQHRTKWWFRAKKRHQSFDGPLQEKVNFVCEGCMMGPPGAKSPCSHEECRAFLRLRNISLESDEKMFRTGLEKVSGDVIRKDQPALSQKDKYSGQTAREVTSVELHNDLNNKLELEAFQRMKTERIKRRRRILAARTRDDITIYLTNPSVPSDRLSDCPQLESYYHSRGPMYTLTLRDIIRTPPWSNLVDADDSVKTTSEIHLLWKTVKRCPEIDGTLTLRPFSKSET